MKISPTKAIISVLILLTALMTFLFFQNRKSKFLGGTFQVDPAKSSDHTPLSKYKDDSDRVTFLLDGNFVWSIYHGHWLRDGDLLIVDHLYDPQERDLSKVSKIGPQGRGIKFFKIISEKDLKEILDPNLTKDDFEKKWFLWLRRIEP